ncbi:MAG: bifunctional folylpolyglutamate synthase/dihydrofolate synthase [Candidatus Marinimicrobia bacterium]|nr:bifunctional folylpolyglutamate synthase/dihydrofolate synthase [Candidatus Neomarinimicrobiota bacterium]
MISNIDTVLEELFSLQRLGIKVGLKHTKEFLNKIGNPHEKLKCIHIAGTNGKGSTCAILSKILIEHGKTVGLYTSPHLVRFNERIKINGEQISDIAITDFMENNADHIKKLKTTFFETATSMAFDYFYNESVDIAIIETGLGGRLDSTNVISPLVCGISSISLDHMDILGDSIEKISKEKAGIIKNNIPIVTFEQSEPIIAVIKEISDRKNAPLTIIKKKDINVFKVNDYGSSFIYKKYAINLPLRGKHQILNCILAIKIAEVILDEIDSSKLNNAIKNSSWPARMEKMSDENIYYDVAHNYDGIRAMIDTVTENHAKKKLLGLFCIKGDKNINSICNLLRGKFNKIIICEDQKRLLLSVKKLSKIMDSQNIDYETAGSVKEGLSMIREIYNEEFIGLIFGSHYIAQEVYSEYGKYFDTTYN